MMSLLDGIALIKNTPAARLSGAELAALRQVAEINPLLASAVGGKVALEEYLAAAEQVQADAPIADVSQPNTVQEIVAARDAPAVLRHKRRQAFLAAALLLIATVIGVLYFGWPREADQPTTSAPQQPTSAGSSASAPDPATVSVVQPTQPPGVPSPTAKSDPDDPPSAGSPTWQGWTLNLSPGAKIAQKDQWDLSDPEARPQMLLVVTGGAAELVSEVQIDDRHCLRIALAEGTAGHGGQIEVRADGKPVARFPLTKAGVHVVPLDFLRGKTVRLAIAHVPGPNQETVVWDTIRLVADKSGVAWTALKPARVEAAGGARLQVRPDDSIIADGPNTTSDQYMVTATIPINVSAVRIEALRDAALPGGGPGRGAKGEFGIARVAASLTEADERHEQLLGRYVRVEQPTPHTAVTLSEVEIFSGGKNVALGKSTIQSSVEGMAWDDLAVDGVTNGVLTRQETSVSRTRGADTGAWWEVDLGREYPLDRIMLWGGPPHLIKDLANHRLIVLDMHRNVVWHYENPAPPAPSLSYGPFVTSRSPLEFQTVIVRTLGAQVEAPWLVRPAANATGSTLRLSEACDFIFPLSRSGTDQGRISLAQRQVTFRIQHQDMAPPMVPPKDAGTAGHDNLGRFRISVTADPVPLEPEPPAEVVPLLPGIGSRGADAPQVARATGVSPVPSPAPPTVQPPTQRTPNVLPKNFAWEGWSIAAEPAALAVPTFRWDRSHTEAPRIEPRFSVQGRTATLSQTRTIDTPGACLRLRAGQTKATAPLGQVEVRVDGKPIARFETLSIEEAPDRLVSLTDFVGRKVKLDLTYLPGSDAEEVDFQVPSFVASPQAAGFAHWQALEPTALMARWKSTLTALPDRSILVGGPNSAGEVYVVTARMPAASKPKEKITAVRIEVLPHPALPMHGPGRGFRGTFNLGRFTAFRVDPNQKPQTHTGRYVRVELLGENRSLALGELQVFAGGKNVALGKPASQPSVMFNGSPELAVDDDTGESYDHRGGVAFAHTSNNAGPVWWEVDLQQDAAIERISLWIRQASGVEWPNHRIIILDRDRKPVWEHTNPEIPVPSDTYEFPYNPQPIRFSAADVSFDFRMRTGSPPLPNPLMIAQPPRDQTVPGWHVSNVPGRMQVATFMLEPGQDLAGQLVRFELGDFAPLRSHLGRFRLSVTTATEPQKALRPVVIVERLK